MNEFYYLSHGGPGSGRYPLGSGDRPYQKFEGSGRRRFSFSGYIRSRKAKKEEEQIKKAIEEKVAAEKQKQYLKDNKEKTLRSGTAADVLQYKGQLTNKELRDAIDRINMEISLKKMSEADKDQKLYEVDDFMKKVKMIGNWAVDSSYAYNAFADIYNSTEKGKNEPLPYIGGQRQYKSIIGVSKPSAEGKKKK